MDNSDYQHHTMELGPGLTLPSRLFQSLFELVSGDTAFGNHRAIGQHNGYAPVVKTKELVVSVGIGELWIDSELSEEGQGLVAEVAALPGDQDDLHEAERSAAG